MKVLRYHDVVNVGWIKLSDINIHEGKLLGYSYNQSCVGLWVVDILCIEDYAIGDTTRLNDHPVQRSNSSGNVSVATENVTKASLGRLSVSQNSDPVGNETKSVERPSISQSPDPVEDSNFNIHRKCTWFALKDKFRCRPGQIRLLQWRFPTQQRQKGLQ